MSAIPEVELRLLALLDSAPGREASWHWLGMRAAALADPVPDVMALLKRLEGRGLVARHKAQPPAAMDRWALTPTGLAAIQPPSSAGPLSPAELAAFAAALQGDTRTVMSALLPLVDDPARLRAALLQVLEADPALARPVFAANLSMKAEHVAQIAERALDHPLPSVRAALFEAWSPPRMDVPGQALSTLLGTELDEAVRRGLLDPSRAVRAAAAGFAFASRRGDRAVGELMANLEAPERDLRSEVLLALGTASDPLSLHALEQIAAEPDPGFAAAAARALASRPDGQRAFLGALHDPRGEVRRAAEFALAEVAAGLPAEALSALAVDPDPHRRDALARYRARAAARG
jgi:hypothetical protein